MYQHMREKQRYLDETGQPVQVEVQILNLAVLREKILQIVFGCLLVQARDCHNPPFDRCAAQITIQYYCNVVIDVYLNFARVNRKKKK